VILMNELVLLLATNNEHKVEELRALFRDSGWRLETPRDRGIVLDPAETGTTYGENARQKAAAFAAVSGEWVLADDSGLEVDALEGAPGIHSARYAGAETPHKEKIRALLAAMEQSGDRRRSGRFRAAFVLVAADGREWQSEGVWEGTIADAPRGVEGFGYDPIFLGTADGRTAAELSAEEKNQLSHRARAAAALVPTLRALAGLPPGGGTSGAGHETSADQQLSHVDASGRARMVDVTEKDETRRVAVARGRVTMRPETLALIEQGAVAKGNVLTTAQIAGVMAAKRTHELIPMCHPLLLTGINVTLTPDAASSSVEITASVRTTGKTGVEMEALTAVSVAALTIYDMCKAVDREMRIEGVRLVEKRGGKSGDVVLE
jgi:cyclic pyranopterin phosphate synthase